ncbi:MAG: hypothetical protein FJZ87_00390 [Chloroflexi bacterium]|nr:hypothetical protein [Chloroflexota bacterium]
MRAKNLIVLVSILLILTACGRTATAAPPTAVPTQTPIPSPTPIPTASTPLVILVLPADMDQPTSDLYQKTVYDLASGSGYRFQVRNALTPTDLVDPTLKVVIALPPDPGLASLAPTAPAVQFLAVDIPDLTAGGNVSVLAPDSQVELPAFMAGYIAALVTEEYHTGMILPQGDQDALRAYNAFVTGRRFYCGLCNTFYYTPITYPTYIEIPPDEDPARYGGYANVLINDRDVDTLYIYPTLAEDEFLSYVGTTGALLIGTHTPEPRPGGWVATIEPNPIKAIQLAWPNLIGGQGGLSIQSPLGLTDVDPALLTPGRLRLAQETLDGLLAGRIAPTAP